LVKSDKKQSPLVGAVCGCVAGGLGAAAMDAYWWAVQKLPGARPEQKPKSGDQQSKPSTQIIADRVSKALTGHELPEEDKPAAGVVVHYATGIVCGGVFGVVASRSPRLSLLGGLVYGTAIWLFLDEIILRVLNVAPDPEKVPIKQHLQALGAHFVFGATTAVVTRLMLNVMRNA
jgi:uncharacterized membrane protein YagU involved in acid resistance